MQPRALSLVVVEESYVFVYGVVHMSTTSFKLETGCAPLVETNSPLCFVDISHWPAYRKADRPHKCSVQ